MIEGWECELEPGPQREFGNTSSVAQLKKKKKNRMAKIRLELNHKRKASNAVSQFWNVIVMQHVTLHAFAALYRSKVETSK